MQEVLKRLRLEKEMDIARLTIQEVEERSSPDSPQVSPIINLVLRAPSFHPDRVQVSPITNLV